METPASLPTLASRSCLTQELNTKILSGATPKLTWTSPRRGHALRIRCGAACSRGRLQGCALRPPHPPHTLLPPLLSGGVRGARLRLPDPAYRGPGGIPARFTRPRASHEHTLAFHALLPPSLQPHSSLYLSSLLPPFLPPPARKHAALPNARPRSRSSQCFSAGSSGHLGWGRRADELPHQHA